MKITILQVGETPKEMQPRFGRYPKQFQPLLLASDKDFSFETKYILDGEKFPSPIDLEGIIITGSAYGVYDNLSWINDLRQFIEQSYEATIPMVGICFGHQVIAETLGGEVEKSHKGWGIGRHTYRLEQKPEFMNGYLSDASKNKRRIDNKISLAASHQDQVIKAPKEARVFLSSDFTPNAGLIYKNGATISLQPHPEFDAQYAKALIDRYDDGRLSKNKVKAAHLSLEKPLDRIEMGTFIARFFKSAKE